MTDHLPALISHTQRPQPPSGAADARAPAQFSREAQGLFLDALSDWGNVRAAAKAAGVSHATAYRMRRACARFRDLWDAALLVARPQVEEVLADRALNGVEEVVFYHGEEIATRRRYDARLLLAHLARLDRLVENPAALRASKDFFAAVEELVNEPEIEFETTAPEEPVGAEPAGARRWAGERPCGRVTGAFGEGAENLPLDRVTGGSSEPCLRRTERRAGAGAIGG
ncbi:MAG: hypothetical protein V2I27_14775 [Erythrobacter sp.]|jgi:hypothetical protein|nr:hypothetical protein [Erythrobacter sp.]